jgi:hypothetical protein
LPLTPRLLSSGLGLSSSEERAHPSASFASKERAVLSFLSFSFLPALLFSSFSATEGGEGGGLQQLASGAVLSSRLTTKKSFSLLLFLAPKDHSGIAFVSFCCSLIPLLRVGGADAVQQTSRRRKNEEKVYVASTRSG